jgi:DNA-binding GntR family transcriptional regulator
VTGELKCGRIVRSLRERIERGEFRDGEELSMRKLAAEYGMNRPVVRDALCALNDDGLATQDAASGQWRVRRPDPSLADIAGRLDELSRAVRRITLYFVPPDFARWLTEPADEGSPR